MQAGALEGKRVLIAEDSWHIAYSLKLTLEGEGAEVVGPAPTVQKACDLLAGREIDLALVDVDLRGELAYPLLEALAARGIRSVVLSGYRDLGELAGEAVTVLGKPAAPERLVTALRTASAAAG